MPEISPTTPASSSQPTAGRQPKFFLLLPLALALAVGAGSLLFAFIALPHWSATHIPLILHGDFPPEARLWISLENGQHPDQPDKAEAAAPEIFPFVPHKLVNGRPTLWLTELPPRTSYTLRLHSTSPLAPNAFQRLETRNLRDHPKPLPLPPPETWQAENLPDSPPTWLIATDWKPFFGEQSENRLWAIASLLGLGAIALAALCAPLNLRPTLSLQTPPPTSPAPPKNWRLYAFACAGLHILLVHNAVSEYWPADSTSYLHKSAHFLQNFTFDTAQYEFELNRLPGTSLIQIIALGLFGGNLDSIALLQALAHAAASLLLLRELRPHLTRFMQWLLPPLLLLTPPAVWASNTLASEGPFLATLLAAFALWLRYESNTGATRRNAFIGFCLLAIFANLIRLNGLIILTLPLLSFLHTLAQSSTRILRVPTTSDQSSTRILRVPTTLAQSSTRILRVPTTSEQSSTRILRVPTTSEQSSTRILRVPTTLAQLFNPLLPVLLVALTLLAWSARNFHSRSFLAPTDLGPVAMANAPLALGWFDPRALDAIQIPPEPTTPPNTTPTITAPTAPPPTGSSLYAEVLRARHDAGYWFHGWALRRILFIHATDNWAKQDNAAIRTTANNLSTFVTANKELIPAAYRLTAYLRSASWALFLAAPHNTVYEPLTRGFTLSGSLAENVATRSTNNIAWVSRQTARPLAYTTAKPEGWMQRAYNSAARHSEKIYPFACLLGLAAYLLSALRGYRLPLFALSIFFANIILNIYVQYVVARYVMVLDVFLYIGILATIAQPSCISKFQISNLKSQI